MCQPVTLLLVGLCSGRLVKRIGAKAQTALSFLLLGAAVVLLGAGLGSIGLMGGSMVLLAMGQSLFGPANRHHEYLLLATCYLLLATYYLLLTTYYLLLTTCY